MPLLKKKSFEKINEPEFLHDDEEVFYCSITNEIFRDYEEFAERMFLCNSMVWACSLTGRTNLTYEEALDSEENARKSLREFPSELKMPILYLASKTRRRGFSDVVEDVFHFAKDRYFIGEVVETSISGSKWKDSHVLQAIAPTDDQVKAALKANGDDEVSNPTIIPANLFKYEIEHLDAFDEDITEMMIAEYSQIRRKKGTFLRDKCKLFLKQFMEQSSTGLLIIKPIEMKNYQIHTMTFDQMFDGPQPQFEQSKRHSKTTKEQNNKSKSKKTKQASLDTFLTKDETANTNGTNANTLERMRKRDEEFKKIKQQREEEQLALKQKKKEHQAIVTEELRNWYKPKEDLELIDQVPLPQTTEIKSKISQEYYGDMLMVLEFTSTFSKILSTKDFFPGGLTLEIVERALTGTEVAGPFIDLLQMLLAALFSAQEAEASQYKAQAQNTQPHVKHEDLAVMSVRDACRLASTASSWSLEHQGMAITRLPLYSLTTSEILRLHLLSSGANIPPNGAKWRYQQRGGYLSEDDPGLYLRLHDSHILKALCTQNVAQLEMGDKLKILTCLVDQLLTYADVRDVVEESLDRRRQAKFEYRSLLAGEKKRRQKYSAARAKLNKEETNKESRTYTLELGKIEQEEEKEMAEDMRRIEETRLACYEHNPYLGQDRAYRQYLKLESVPGVFISAELEMPGKCLGEVVRQDPSLTKGTRKERKEAIKQLFTENLEKGLEASQMNGLVKNEQVDELLMCASNLRACQIHSTKIDKVKWSFLNERTQLDELIETLNVRGKRENALLENLKSYQGELEVIIEATPCSYLNSKIVEKVSSGGGRRSVKAKYDDANLGYSNDMSIDDIQQSALIENLLEMEEKIFAGNLGSLAIKNRDKWREDLQNKNWSEMDKTLQLFDENNVLKREEERSRSATPSSEASTENLNTSHFIHVDPNVDNKEILNNQPQNTVEAIQTLAVALAQIGQSVMRKYLKKPLGRIGANKLDKKLNGLLSSWEQSLLASTSFSQIFLHYSTLDNCVMWARSVLVARCRICRRQNDSENMLLCDSCNLGHHLYCLKPKLKSVPAGDWFCSKCQTEKQKLEAAAVVTPVKKRPIFRDEEIDDETSENGDDSEQESEETSDDSEDDDGLSPQNHHQNSKKTKREEVCKTCGADGEMISCEKCGFFYHSECTEPPLRRLPRGPWSCTACKKVAERKNNDRGYMVNGKVVQRSAIVNGQRRCAAKALYKIHDFAKSLRHQSPESDDSSEDEVFNRRSSRREEGRTDLPLHNAALHEVLSEIMKDGNAWPFLRPVQKTEVPDYYDVITKPMDFGTIKYKLNMGEYTEDAHFMSDALLVFQNCNTYNHTEDDVYKCGVQLLKHFQRKCRELGLKLPELMDYNDEARSRKRPRK